MDPEARDAAAQVLEAVEAEQQLEAQQLEQLAPGAPSDAPPADPAAAPLSHAEATDVCVNFALVPLYVRELLRLRKDKAPRPDAADVDAKKFADRGAHALARFRGSEKTLRTVNFYVWLLGAGLEFWARGAERDGAPAEKTVQGEAKRVA